MTALLEQAVAAMRNLPPKAQESLAQAILSVAQDDVRDQIAPEHLPFVLEGLAQIERVEVATDEEVTAAFRSFGP